MTWVLVEVVPFLIGAFALGLLTGYAVWKWRRQSVDAETWTRVTTESHRARNELELLEQQHLALAHAKETLSTRLSAMDHELDAVRSDLKSAQKQGNQYRAQRDSALTRIEAITSELSRLRERLGVSEDGLRVARETIAELVIHEAEARQLKDEVALRDGRLADLEQTLVHSETETEEISSRMSEMESTLDATRSELEDARERISDLDQLLASSRFERDAAQTKLGELRVELAEAQSKIADISGGGTDDAALRADLRAAREEVNRRSATTHRVRADLASAHRRMAELELELANTTQTLLGYTDPENNRPSVRAELEMAREHIAKLEAELSESETALLDLEDAHDRIAELETQLEQLSSAAVESNGHAATAARTRELSAELGSLRVALAERNRRIEALELATRRMSNGRVGASTSEHGEEAEVIDIRTGASDQVELRDDLTVIVGVGERIEKLLNADGVFRWEQLASLDEAGVARLNEVIDVPAQIDPADWVRQAHQLVARYPDLALRPDRRLYRKSTTRKDRVTSHR